ncbi:glycosyltransferase [Halovenus sp. WSH3]|uniref:Glycosyltransferase n=1 Tax=Halovenus carboxidivorans TaxID=2692199 RepID=A0A6B0T2Q4_9EURY|nr:glycosyltransferase [Halovenus carboxidivorans]MXR51407.1 glycosyltransferase [Halovenus carboxidivorans]
MRVALVAMETAQQVDSAGARRFERIGRLLADRGHEVTVFCGQWWDSYTDEWTVGGLRYRGVTLGSALASFCVRLPALLGAYDPDIVHVRPVPGEQVLAAAAGSRLARAPLFAEWFGDEQLSERRRTWAATAPTRAVTPSQLVRTRIREYGATEEQTMVIPESIDTERIEAVDPAEGIDIVYAHRLDESANIEDFLLGMAELRERDWTATIIGDGPKRSDYEQEAADLRIDDRVTFVGACDRQRRLELYRGAHAFVQTAYREEFATELLWALACGCIGIVEYQAESSAHELIENYERSYRVTDPQELADAIVDAGGFEHRTRDDHWDSHDHGVVIERYLDAYRDLRGQ